MTASPAIRAALEAARDALAEIVAEAPADGAAFYPRHGTAQEREDWAFDSASWARAETARPALEKINAALAEMEAQS
jgi:hypothetical protein